MISLTHQSPRRRAAACSMLVVALVGLAACSSSSTKSKRTPVRQVFVVESSWFSTDPPLIRENLTQVAARMKTCGGDPKLDCQVMMYVVEGAEVSAKRVPTSLPQNSKLGFWYSLSGNFKPEFKSTFKKGVQTRTNTFVRNVAAEIVPPSYDAQPHGCVNLVTTIGSAFAELRKHPGDRNIVTIYASGLSNCLGQPFYPGKPFPTEDEAITSLLGAVPKHAAKLKRGTVCVEWSPMFAKSYLEKNMPISQEQAQVMKAVWDAVIDAWGATRGNEPGEQTGSCLSMGATK